MKVSKEETKKIKLKGRPFNFTATVRHKKFQSMIDNFSSHADLVVDV